MAKAKLHIICGNCGCNDNFEYRHVNDFTGPDDATMQQKTQLACKNCSTLHVLDNNAQNLNPVTPVAPVNPLGYQATYTNLNGDLKFASLEQRNKALALMVDNHHLSINEHGEYWWTNKQGDNLGLAIVSDNELELEIPDTLYEDFDNIQSQVLALCAGGEFSRISTEDTNEMGIANTETEKSVFVWFNGDTYFTNSGTDLITLCRKADPDCDIDLASSALCESNEEFEYHYPDADYTAVLWSALDNAREAALDNLKAKPSY